ncbi:MAG: ATP-dependent protease [Thermodesulfobacteriota bacterium]|nr:MAG: ATP-dependent protease [Thermodesulfobacteriota bacterium]
MTTIVPLDPEKLRLNINPESLGFQKLSQLKTEERPLVAQERAIQALTFGLRMEHPDFNIYVAGINETGLSDLARSYVEEVAKDSHPLPSDWCYVYNFRNPDKPSGVELQEGKGREFKKDMADLLDELKLQIPKIFEAETYISRKEEVIKAFNKDRKNVFQELDKKVRENGFLLQSDQSVMMVVPAKEDGTALTPEDLSKMPEEEQKELKARSEGFHKDMGDAMRRIQKSEQSVRRKLKELNQEVVGQTVNTLLEPLKKKYESIKILQDYFADVREDVVRNMDDFRPKSEATQAMPFSFPGAGPSFTRYEVNILVDNSDTKGAPVVIESNPSYPNLFGVVERKAQFGALFTDFTMIKPGAIHRANGGYLLIKALDLLKWPFSYEALKRALRNRKIEIEDPGEQFGLFTTKALKPEPISLRIKIVLMGNPFIYQLLYNYDEDFKELFKVKAHLDVHVDRNEERLEQFMRSAKVLVERENLRDMHMSGVASLIEFSSELAGSQEKLSLKISDLADLLREADFWAKSENSELIEDKHIQKAIDEKAYRCSLYEDHLHEMLKKDILKVATTGKAVGQVNGLSIYDLGDYMFGKPSRITVNIALGKEGVVNLEREADLSGSIHTKGVMILAGYLKAHFSADRPLSLTASICFEQSYGMVDGDSASGAELFALLSALSDVPLDQGIAVTGAMSQKGEILPVGGVTRKIEGFFDICEARNLTGEQGVIIPETNVKDLMLKPKVIEAIKQGKFQIWAISRVEEGIEILTGQPAGIPGPDGSYPEDSVFAKVNDRLRKLAEEAKLFMQKEEAE